MRFAFRFDTGAAAFFLGGSFGGGAFGGVKVTPIAFMVIKEGSVRMLPVAVPPSTTADRIVEQVPDVLEQIASYFDSRKKKDAE